MTQGWREDKCPSVRAGKKPRAGGAERGRAHAPPLSAPPARGFFPARTDGHLSSRQPCVIRHANE
ncbi:hypothetical protein [Salmonella enterica]|uniref:hypothetical protein n=1 Tax=Salmonella enterica TaxID=28901 RepID=UPI00398C5B08